MTPTLVSWTPSATRKIALVATGYNGGGQAPAVLPLRWPPNPAGAVLDYAIDAGVMLSGPTDTLTVAVGDAAGVVVASTIVLGGIVTVWLSGGAPGTDATVPLVLTSGSGRVSNRTVRIGIV